MDIVTYALCKKIAASAAAGIKDMYVDGTKLIIITSDDKTLEIDFPTPADGVSITDVDIVDKHLICTMSDGTVVDAGEVPYFVPQKGVDYWTEDDKDEIIQKVIESVDESLVLTDI